ncbi:hypothetical protein SUGI_0841350 [Cryptomeria japonica]|nr:hypothetical protein SUGI_0841350 [Cryptomeria japonica]
MSQFMVVLLEKDFRELFKTQRLFFLSLGLFLVDDLEFLLKLLWSENVTLAWVRVPVSCFCRFVVSSHELKWNRVGKRGERHHSRLSKWLPSHSPHQQQLQFRFGLYAHYSYERMVKVVFLLAIMKSLNEILKTTAVLLAVLLLLFGSFHHCQPLPFLRISQDFANHYSTSHLKAVAKVESSLIRAQASIRRAARMPNSTPTNIYRNAPAFYKSYAEMEKRFKIFVYPEGEPPLVHWGPCRSIYSTEGRFIHQLELPGTPFVTSHPEEAQVFFLPFSVAMMVNILTGTAVWVLITLCYLAMTRVQLLRWQIHFCTTTPSACCVTQTVQKGLIP